MARMQFLVQWQSVMMAIPEYSKAVRQHWRDDK